MNKLSKLQKNENKTDISLYHILTRITQKHLEILE